MDKPSENGLDALTFLIFVGVWAMFFADENRLKAIEEILSGIIFATASVAGVYMGLAALSQMEKIRGRMKNQSIKNRAAPTLL